MTFYMEISPFYTPKQNFITNTSIDLNSQNLSHLKCILTLFRGLVDEGGSQMPSLGAVVVTDRITDMSEVFLLFDWGGLGP